MGSRTVSGAVRIGIVRISTAGIYAASTCAVSTGLTGVIWGSLVDGLFAAPAAVAQAAETGCRQTNALTGIYVQPSLESSSRGILASGQTVRLEVTSSGTGWARVVEPLIGWVEAKYLTPATACTGFTASTPQSVAQPASQPTQPSDQPTPTRPQGSYSATVTPGTVTPGTSPVTATCDVLPAEGLIVRSEPTTTSGTVLQTIPKGTYQFQFTSDHVRSHSGEIERDWAYITAPYQGCIAVGIVGGQFNLGGKACG